MPEKVRHIKTARAYYDDMPYEQAICRGRGVHDFWVFDPTADELPSEVRVTGLGRSRYRIVTECSNECGKVKTEVYRFTAGHFVLVKGPRYTDPEDWVRTPRGVMKPTKIRGFLMDDSATLIIDSAEPDIEVA